MGAPPGTMGRSDHPPHPVSNIDNRFRFARNDVAADPRSAAWTRAQFSTWLETHFTLGADRFSDVLLAVNEAIANAAEFAYRDAPQTGTLDVSAAYDRRSDTLTVAVDDRGRWRPEVAAQRQQLRGRGIPLMEVLADEVTIDRTPRGPRVTLTWTDLTQRSDA